MRSNPKRRVDFVGCRCLTLDSKCLEIHALTGPCSRSRRITATEREQRHIERERERAIRINREHLQAQAAERV